MTLDKVSQVYQTRSGPRTVLREVSLCVRPGEKIGILGRNGAGKSTLIRLMSGAELPTMGTVERRMSVSWPLAFSGAFQGSLTGLDNLRFICRIYGAAIGPAIAFVDDFAELGPYLREPVRHYSSGMRARLAFAVSLAVDFDCFLIDEIVAVGDSRFHAKCEDELFRKRADRAMVIVSHHAAYIAAHCERAAVLSDGRLTAFDGIQHAFDAYHAARPADAGGDTDTGQAAQAAQAASR